MTSNMKADRKGESPNSAKVPVEDQTERIRDAPIVQQIWKSNNVWSVSVERKSDHYILNLGLGEADPKLPRELNLYGQQVKIAATIVEAIVPYMINEYEKEPLFCFAPDTCETGWEPRYN